MLLPFIVLQWKRHERLTMWINLFCSTISNTLPELKSHWILSWHGSHTSCIMREVKIWRVYPIERGHNQFLIHGPPAQTTRALRCLLPEECDLRSTWTTPQVWRNNSVAMRSVICDLKYRSKLKYLVKMSTVKQLKRYRVIFAHLVYPAGCPTR